MFVMNRTVFIGTEGGPNSVLLVQEGSAYVVRQTRASYNFLLFVVLTLGPQWPALIFHIANSVVISSIFFVLYLPLLAIWGLALRAYFKNPIIRIDITGKQVILEKGRFSKKHVTIRPEHVKLIQIIYTIYQDSRGNTLSNFILEIVSPTGKSRSLCISDNLYLIRKIGLRMQEALGAKFELRPIDDPAHHNLWSWRSQRKKTREEEKVARKQRKIEDRERRQREKDRRAAEKDRRKAATQEPEEE